MAWRKSSAQTRAPTSVPGEQPSTSSEPEPEQPDSLQPRTESSPEPQTTLEWLRQFEADMAAVERAIEREHQAAIDAGQPWPPTRRQHTAVGPGTTPETNLAGTEPAAEHDNSDARITETITDAAQAAQFLREEEEASRQARSDYAARISREAEAQPEAHAALTAEVPADAEIEL